MAAKWYYLREGQEHGPLAAEDLRVLADSDGLSPDDLVRRGDQDQSWVKASSVKGLFTKRVTQEEVPPNQSDQSFLETVMGEPEEAQPSDNPRHFSKSVTASDIEDSSAADQILSVLQQTRSEQTRIADLLSKRQTIVDFTVMDWLSILVRIGLANLIIAVVIAPILGLVLAIMAR